MLVYRIGICYNNYILYNNSTYIDRYFEDISVYIPGFMQSLWDSPESIATILVMASIEDIKNNLAYFVASYLYENIVKTEFDENNDSKNEEFITEGSSSFLDSQMLQIEGKKKCLKCC